MLSQCSQGAGHVFLSASETPLAPFFQSATGIDPSSTHLDTVALTPPDTATTHPFWDYSADTPKRSTNDLRSFFMTVQDMPGKMASLTVKGGDMPYVRKVVQERGFSTLRRAKNGQIPGGGILGAIQTEYNAGSYMHLRSLHYFDELAPTTIPLRLTTISHLPDEEGKLTDVISYANSERYAGDISNARKTLGLSDEEGLGDMLFRRFGLQPCEYIYALSEPYNVRVNDAYSYRLFGFLDQNEGYDVDAYNASMRDPLVHMNTDFDRMGDNFDHGTPRKDRVIRNIYHMLADTYGFVAEDVLPTYEITDRNYIASLGSIAAHCQAQGIDQLVLDRFIGNMTRMAALAHSDGRVFCRGDVSGGSFMPRNVSLGGSVLDLDTLGKLNPDAHWQKIPRDIMEMTLSITSIERLVRTDDAPTLFDTVLNRYAEALRLTGMTGADVQGVTSHLQSDEAVVQAAKCLQNHDMAVFEKH